MPVSAALLLVLVISCSASSSSLTPPPQETTHDFVLTAAIDSLLCNPPHVMSRCITLALRLRSTASPSPPAPPLISHARLARRLSTLLSPSALAASTSHSHPSASSSYTACITLASSFLSLRLLPLAVQLARACSVLWPNQPPPPANVKTCAASLQQCVAEAIACDASAATQAQYSAHGSITRKLQQPMCALPALLVYVSIFSRSPPPPPHLVTLGAQACVSASLYQCSFLLLTRSLPSDANPPSPCLVTWLSIMSLRLPPPPFPHHMFTPNCIPLLLLLAQGSQGVGAAAVHALAHLWPHPVPPSPFPWPALAAAQQLLLMYAGEFSMSSSVGRELSHMLHHHHQHRAHNSLRITCYCLNRDGGSSKSGNALAKWSRDHAHFCDIVHPAHSRADAVSYSQDEDVARHMNSLRPHIIVDLHGHMPGNRARVFSLRPAASQIVFKNWVGSMGAPAAIFSHVIGDRIASPADHAHLFTERIVMHPLSFFAPAAYSPPPAAAPAQPTLFEQFMTSCGERQEGQEAARKAFEFGIFQQQLLLPSSWGPERRVICNFNVPFKSSRSDAAAWGRVLAEGKAGVGFMTVAHPDLLDGVQALVTYITSACAAHASNMSGSGSIECPVHILPHMSQSDHTAIKALLCDVTADSSNYNGHSTVAETLYMGLPCVTQPGVSMASRVAASLLLLGSRVSVGVAMPGEYEAVLAVIAGRKTIAQAATKGQNMCLAAGRRHPSTRGLGRSSRAWVSAMQQWVLLWERRLRIIAELAVQGASMHVT